MTTDNMTQASGKGHLYAPQRSPLHIAKGTFTTRKRHLYETAPLRLVAAAVVMLMWMCAAGARPAAAVKRIAYPGGRCYMYRLTLRDKHGTPYTLQQPERYLSQKAIERRRRQSLTVDSTDLPVSPQYVRAIRESGVQVVSMSKWNNTLLVRGKNQRQMQHLEQLPFVVSARKVWTSPDSIDASPKRAAWHSEFNSWDALPEDEYGVCSEQVSSLNGLALHADGHRGRGMTIAVLDGGFMNVDKIPAFSQVRILGTHDFVVPASENIYKEVDHGTMVLSAMAVSVPNIYKGTAPEASFWLLRCEDTSTESLAEEDYWAAAAEFADSVGVDVINSSLGFHSFDDKTTNHTYAQLDGHTALISRTASLLASKGIVLVNSAGNDGMGTWKKINFPADASDILTVGAVSPEGMNAAFSAVGPTADGRVKPDVMAMGSPAAVVSGRGTIIRDMGTSFSSPLVAGLVACLWQALPRLTAVQIEEAVRRSAHNYSTPDNVFGYGIPDFGKAYNIGKGMLR